MKPILLLILTCLIVGTIIFYRIRPLTPTIIINGTTFTVELAVTGKEMEKGLGGRSVLPPKHGMLFIRDHKDLYPFWMKGMNFPLDFIWMDGNLIVDITKNVPTMQDGLIPQLKPKVPVDKILELNAGEIDAAGIKIGDTALFNK
jgi:uncharacterized membrane protein (UPF0127 family)